MKMRKLNKEQIERALAAAVRIQPIISVTDIIGLDITLGDGRALLVDADDEGRLRFDYRKEP